MSSAHRERTRAPAIVRVLPAQPPAWLAELAADLRPEAVATDAAIAIAETANFAIVRAEVSVRDLDDVAFRAAVRDTYTRIGRSLRERSLFAWRFWNYVPEIRKPATIGANRYQVFNAGRCEGARDGFSAALPDAVPAASAVGHAQASLVIELLAGRAPGVAVENPRQIPPVRYSQRWGPLPPWFSRAMALPVVLPAQRERWALVSGTASIVGEESRHPRELLAQIRETCTNLATLAAVLTGVEPDAALARFRELRVYVVRDADVDAVAAAFGARFPHLDRIEIALADLCRDELLLEAEGVVALDARAR